MCVKKYLLSTLEDPHCMHCKHSWDLFFTNKILSRNYMTKEWKLSRSQLLFNREKSYFPETMPLVSKEIEKEDITNKIKEIEQQEQFLKVKKQQMIHRLYSLQHNSTEYTTKTNKFNIRQCPTANCKGFLDDSYCILCKKQSCLKCNVNIDTNPHECKEEDIETWQQILKLSKPCPNCGTRIQKASGCSQMWCLGCHIAFNWNTGQIEKGPIHNPHYYEWAEKLGMNQNEQPNNPCDERRVWNFYNYFNIKTNDRTSFRNLHQRLNHFVNHEFVNLREKTVRNNDNTDLRIKFIRNQITEDIYKKKLICREIQNQKNTRLLEIFQVFSNFITQILQNYMNKKIEFIQLQSNINDLQKFVNENIDEINSTFNSNISHINI
jgi:hypothetical protein